MPSINTAYFTMLLQIYKSISEKQKKIHKSYTLKLYNLWVSSFYYRTCFCKRIGGSCEPLARKYLHSSPNPSFGKGGALAMEEWGVICLFLCLLASSAINTMTAPAVWQYINIKMVVSADSLTTYNHYICSLL